jgi:hypothetical protein
LPEEWLIERNQQVGANSRNLLSPSFVAVCRIFAAAFRTLRYIFVTVLDSDCKGEAAVIPKSLCPRLKGFLSASRKLFGLGLQADSGFCRRGQRRQQDGGTYAGMPETGHGANQSPAVD